jgi:hypothetical protein
MKSAGVTFTQNSTVDSVATKPGPDIAVPSFERSLEEFSHNCDALLYELVRILISCSALRAGLYLNFMLSCSTSWFVFKFHAEVLYELVCI